jgi:hypothetical protein
MTEITKKQASDFLAKYHYLNKEGAGFRTGINYGLYNYSNNESGDVEQHLIAVVIYHTPSVAQTRKGMLGEHNIPENKKMVYEMGRLCLHPDFHKKNILSKFVATTFKLIKRDYPEIDYILTYADDGVHSGKIYQALSMNYYGLSAQKNDFWFELEDDSGAVFFKKHQRGSVKGKAGKWRPRTRKHRYVKCLKKDGEKKIVWKSASHKDIPVKEGQVFNS